MADKKRKQRKLVAENRQKRMDKNSHMTYRTKEQMNQLIDEAYEKFTENPIEMTFTQIANETGIHRKTIESIGNKGMVNMMSRMRYLDDSQY